MVVAQLVEWSLPTPEIRASNPVIVNFFTINCIKSSIEKTKIKKKEARNGPILTKLLMLGNYSRCIRGIIFFIQ